MKKINLLLLLIALTFTLTACGNKGEVINIYTTRHYDSDELLYEEFTNETGIEVNIIVDKAALSLDIILKFLAKLLQ